jgi:predicted molibdopterin-dependent oxidoreductase YjgC
MEPRRTVDKVRLSVDGRVVTVPAGTSVAAAIALAGGTALRRSVTGQARGALCGMGICFECRVTIDGAANRRSCQIACRPGMSVVTDVG